MRFTKVVLILVVVAILAGCCACWAEERYDVSDLIQYGYEEVVAEFDPEAVFSVRSYYTITLPEDPQDIPEAIVAAYGNLDRILLIEYGCYNIHPILESTFACVGASEDGLFILPTPFDLVAKTYDPASFDDVIIDRVY